MLYVQFTHVYCILYLYICFNLHTKYRKKLMIAGTYIYCSF